MGGIMMKSSIIGLLSETSMHPGAESSTGIIDLPVAREVSTEYPVIVGSSLKGAFREGLEKRGEVKIADEVFGKANQVGDIAITDGRLLLLPVRTLIGHYKWVTCPYILERFSRDIKLAGYFVDGFKVPKLEQGKALYHGVEEEIFLEEITFTRQENKETIGKVVEQIKPLISHQSVKDRLLEQLVIVNDDDFNYYAKYGLEVRARNKLSSETKTSDNLWYEECLPPDTLFYTLLICRTGKETSLDQLVEIVTEKPYIQIGGNETIGQGWCILSCWEEEKK